MVFLSLNTTITARTTVMKERLWINRIPSETVFEPLQSDTATALQCQRNRICLSSYASEMSFMGMQLR